MTMTKRQWNKPGLLSLEAAIVTKQGYSGNDPLGADAASTNADGSDGEPTLSDGTTTFNGNRQDAHADAS